MVDCIMMLQFESFSLNPGIFHIVTTVQPFRYIAVQVSIAHIPAIVAKTLLSDVAGNLTTTSMWSSRILQDFTNMTSSELIVSRYSYNERNRYTVGPHVGRVYIDFELYN